MGRGLAVGEAARRIGERGDGRERARAGPVVRLQQHDHPRVDLSTQARGALERRPLSVGARDSNARAQLGHGGRPSLGELVEVTLHTSPSRIVAGRLTRAQSRTDDLSRMCGPGRRFDPPFARHGLSTRPPKGDGDGEAQAPRGDPSRAAATRAERDQERSHVGPTPGGIRAHAALQDASKVASKSRRRRARVGWSTVQRFPKRNAPRVLIAARRRRLTAKLLGRHVPRGAASDRDARRTTGGPPTQPSGCQPEVGDAHPAIGADQDVVGLHVAVHDTGVVGCRDSEAHGSEQLDDLVAREPGPAGEIGP